MHKITWIGAFLLINNMVIAQQGKEVPQKVERPKVEDRVRRSVKVEPLTPQKLWELGRVSAEGISNDGSQLIYGVSNYQLTENKSEKNLFVVPVNGGEARQLTAEAGAEFVLNVDADEVLYLFKGQIWKKSLKEGSSTQLTDYQDGLENVKISPDGKHILFSKQVQLKPYYSTEKYKDLPKSNVYIYDNLDYRHWDTWNDGKFNHPFVATYNNGVIGEPKDILTDEPYYSPTMPFGGAEDLAWSSDGKSVLYVCKKKFGTEYAQSTNTDIFRYDLESGSTTNLTKGMNGYDNSPSFSSDGKYMAWLSMKTEGFEADKNDIYIQDSKTGQKLNLTAHWDGTVTRRFILLLQQKERFKFLSYRFPLTLTINHYLL